MKTLTRQTETVRIFSHSCQSRIKTKLSVVEDAVKPSRRIQESVLTPPSLLLLLLLLCQRGLVHDLRGGRLRFLRGDEPRRSSAIHRQEDESAHSVSSSSQHKKHILLLLWFSVCRDSTCSRQTVALILVLHYNQSLFQ